MTDHSEMPEIIDDYRYESRVAGKYLGNYKEPTMRNSRYTGRLAGVKAPPHIKMGSKVLYQGVTLKKWRAQFKEQACTNDPAGA